MFHPRLHFEWHQHQGRDLVKERNDADDFASFQAARFLASIRERSRKRYSYALVA